MVWWPLAAQFRISILNVVNIENADNQNYKYFLKQLCPNEPYYFNFHGCAHVQIFENNPFIFILKIFNTLILNKKIKMFKISIPTLSR